MLQIGEKGYGVVLPPSKIRGMIFRMMTSRIGWMPKFGRRNFVIKRRGYPLKLLLHRAVALESGPE